ncbi:MAG: GNAT family N-acetyltransferase [Bryobacteraceae bacterium]
MPSRSFPGEHPAGATIQTWGGEAWTDGGGTGEDLQMLAELLHAAVHVGASVSFVLPFPVEQAYDYWRNRVAPSVRAGDRRLLVARQEGAIAGTVQLILDMPPNQPHRAEVAKLLVHPRARRQGIARALMGAVEDVARAEGRTLLTLDTRTGDAAEPLYLSMGYVLAGVIPRYARGPSGSGPEATSILYKELSGDCSSTSLLR